VRVLVTGASGFLGRYVVSAALRRGHAVEALVRPASSHPFTTLQRHPALRVVQGDLRTPRGLDALVQDVDAVVHLAATKAGDLYTQFAGTVLTTENLLGAMGAAGIRRLVGMSTFSVYDMGALATRAVLDESSPVVTDPETRDEYTQTKLLQETMYRSFAAAGNEVCVVRPGMIYGRDELWHPLLGSPFGPVFLRVGSRAVLPMTYVENCADAVVLALADQAVGETLNIVDDDLPTQAEYVEAVTRVMPPPRSVTVPWPVMRGVASAFQLGNRLLAGGRAKLPGIVVPARLDNRFKPLRYSNTRAKAVLGWSPRYGLDEAVRRSTSGDDLLVTDLDLPVS
jgi:nucleoside-diphosphate-sugar epimerase